MYKTIFLFIFIYLQLTSFGQDVTYSLNWLSIEEAERKNSLEQKKILIDIYADWCYWCKKIDSELASDSVLANYLNKNFYLVKLNPEDLNDINFKNEVYQRKTFSYSYSDKTRKVNEFVIELLGNDFIYPSLIFMNEKLDVVLTTKGFKNSNELNKYIHFIGSNAYQKMKWTEFINK
ncbi:MAG: thioredoxin family protein [Chitinophagales bacterium]